MSIYGHWGTVGENEDFEPNNEVLSYTHSGRFPNTKIDKPGTVDFSAIPPWCDPSVPEDSAEAYPNAEWLRMYICTWNEEYQRPMTSNEATVLLNENAVKEMIGHLQAWIDHREEASA